MEPIFSEKQLQNMSKENIIALMQTMQAHQKKQETKIQILEEKMQELEFMNALLSDRLALAKRKQFGSSSEKYADGYTQMNLFDEAEQEAGPDASEPEMEEITYVYSCPKCGSMKRPQKKPALLKGSIATPSLVAGIMNAKYVNGMPLARQEREFARYDLNLSTKTMANWIILCAKRYLQPVYDLMKEEFLRSRYIHCEGLCKALHNSSGPVKSVIFCGQFNTYLSVSFPAPAFALV